MLDNSSWTITHDFSHAWGGAEKCTEVLASHVLQDPSTWVISGNSAVTDRMFPRGSSNQTKMLFPMDRFSASIVRALAPVLYPVLRIIPPTTDNLLASSYALAHLRRTKGLKAIYCHSPFRQIYSGVSDYFPANKFIQKLVEIALAPFRYIDRKAAREAHLIIATNQLVAERVRIYWGREPDAIIPPPIDTETFHPVPSPSRDYFVWAGRIVEPYKRVGLLIETFREHPDKKLVVVGDGRDRAVLEASAPANVSFVGRRQGEELNTLLANAEALLFPSGDDFGMVPLEAMAAGTPVIGYSGGGARETVLEGQTGVLFDEHTPESLGNAFERFRETHWDYESIRTHSERFSQDSFVRNVKSLLSEAILDQSK